MNKKYFKIMCQRAAWLLLGVLFLSPTLAHATSYYTLSAGTHSTSVLSNNYSGKHVKILGDVTLNVDQDLYLREINGDGANGTAYNLNIVLSNGTKLTIDQDEKKAAAVALLNLNITGNGTVLITGRNYGVVLSDGGKLTIGNGTNASTNAIIEARSSTETCKAITGNEASVEINRANVQILSKKIAVIGSDENIKGFNTFTVKPNSQVTITGSVGGSIAGGIDNFNMEGGSVTINSSNNTALHTWDFNMTGGMLQVYQSGGDILYDAGINCDRNIIAKNAILVVEASQHAIKCKDANFENSHVILKAGSKGYGFYSKYGYYLTITDDGTNSEGGTNWFKATGGKGGIWAENSTVTIANKIFYAQANNSDNHGVYVDKLIVNLQPGAIYDSYSDKEPFYAKNVITLQRPTKVRGPNSTYGKLDPSTPNYFLSLNQNNNTWGPCYEVVHLSMPDIAYISGYKEENLLGTLNRVVYPGETLSFNFSALTPYITYDNPVKTISIYKKESGVNGAPVQLVMQLTNTNSETVDYTFVDSDVSHQFWGEVGLDAYAGTLKTPIYSVLKKPNDGTPVKPNLELRNNKVYLTNAKKDQEYIIILPDQLQSFQNDMSNASWWANSRKPTADGSVILTEATQGKTNYVYTRFGETAGTLVGSKYQGAAIYFGSTVELQAITLEATPVGNNFLEPDFNNTYDTKLNGVFKVEMKPIPSNATNFVGGLGEDWYTNYVTGEKPLLFYANQACTQTLNASTHYKTVYVKANLEGYEWLIGATADDNDDDPENQNGPFAKLNINVGDANGNFEPHHLLVNNGDTLVNYNNEVEGIPFEVFPARATLDGNMTVTYNSVSGPFPSQASQTDRRPTFTIDKENRTIALTPGSKDMLQNHTYVFSVRHNNSRIGYNAYDYLRVKVVNKPLNSLSISPAESTLELGASLPLEISSDLPEAWRQYVNERTCVSSDESVATVKWDWYKNEQTYIVTMTDDASKIGKSATITLNVNGVEATCVVTVAGEIYPIMVKSVQVNSANQEDVLGDGKVSYEGGTLYINNAGTIIQDSSSPALFIQESETLPVVNIDVRGNNIFHSMNGNGIQLNGDVVLKGDGYIAGSGKIYGTTAANHHVSVSDSVQMESVGDSYGLRAGSLDVSSDAAQAKIKGNYGKSLLVTGNLWGDIIEPAGAYLGADGWVVDAGGNAVAGQYVIINGIGTPDAAVPGDVNGDGVCTASDVTALYNYILYNDSSAIVNGDQNGDGSITASDVTKVYNIILGL